LPPSSGRKSTEQETSVRAGGQADNGDLLADSHNILKRRKNCISQLLNVHRVSDVRQIEIHTAER
jgi:hypothetical protein